jgi:hypothetical protein
LTKTYHHGNKAKERKFGKLWRWMNTPSWFTRMMMTKPQRKAAHDWERKAATSSDIEQLDTPPHGKKPHIYYW